MSEFWKLDATAQAAAIRRREVSAREAVAEAIARADAVDPIVNSIVHRRDELAIVEAVAIDEAVTIGTEAGFAGVPFAVKDWKCTTAGEPSTWGMKALAQIGHRSNVTTVLAERYRRAGLVSIGRTNLPELAFGPPTTESDLHGPCRNPWNTAMSVGGSSGGSAAAVAAGIVPVANASDGGGSLRIPAACCGLVGLKVSRGRITNAPHADGRGAKVEGHLARTVRDVAALLDATAGSVPGDPYALATPGQPYTSAIATPPAGLRIGVMERAPRSMDRHGDGHPGANQLAALSHACALLDQLGHHVAQSHPAGLDEPLSTPQLYSAERAALRSDIERVLGRPLTIDDVEPRTWAMFEMARNSAGPEVIAELDREQRWARQIHRWWHDGNGFDLMLTPALGRDVPFIGELKETAEEPLGRIGAGFPLAWFTYPFNVAGNPAIVVPITQRPGGPPTAVQFVAAIGREDLLLRLAAQLEDAIGWNRWWPDDVDVV
jgi:amidase